MWFDEKEGLNLNEITSYAPDRDVSVVVTNREYIYNCFIALLVEVTVKFYAINAWKRADKHLLHLEFVIAV